MKIFLWLILSIFSGILYHISGRGGFPNAKLFRRVLCPLLALGLFIYLKGITLGFWWAYGLFLAFNYGALSTYHDYTGKDNFYLTGLFYGLAALPIAIGTMAWAGFIIRSVVLAGLIGYLRERTGKVAVEEIGSGFLYCASMPILLL